MNTKRMMRWIIVLFLLAALPVMTAVMAQGQEPGNASSEETRPAFLNVTAPPNVFESEPNDTRQTANTINVNDVIGGDCERSSDTGDWYRFNMLNGGYVLIEISAESYGAVGYRLTDSAGKPLSYAYRDYEHYGALLFENLHGGDYYIEVSFFERDSSCVAPNSLPYRLTISSPLLVSAGSKDFKGGGSVAGVDFYSQDILAYSDLNNGEERWQMFFDGSEAGITSNVIAVAASGPGSGRVWDGDEILITTADKPYDIYIYDPIGPSLGTGYNPPEGYGRLTNGTWRMGLEGAVHGLTTATEKLDAIENWVNGSGHCYGFPVSTVGVAEVPGIVSTVLIKSDDEDIFCKVYNGSWQHWTYFFDVKGKRNAPKWWVPAAVPVPGMPREDVFALAYNDDTDVMYLTIQGTGNIMGHAVTQKDIFAINYPGYTWGGVVWHGPDHGWNYNIDAIELNGW